MNLTNQIPEITRRIIETSHPEKIILFGSYARGNFGRDSDLDLLVIIPGVCLSATREQPGAARSARAARPGGYYRCHAGTDPTAWNTVD